jgi:hypothetical protein
MGGGSSGPGMRRFTKENLTYLNKDLEGSQIRENEASSLESKDEQI